LKGPYVTDPTLSDGEIRLNERELAVAKEAARLAIQEITDQFYKQVGKTMVQKVWIGAIAIGFGLAKGWITFTPPK
jgi:hypothetical protein